MIKEEGLGGAKYDQAMDWQIEGLGAFAYLTGDYSQKAAIIVLEGAKERAEDWYEFDQMIEGRGPGTGLLSGSQLLVALHL